MRIVITFALWMAGNCVGQLILAAEQITLPADPVLPTLPALPTLPVGVPTIHPELLGEALKEAVQEAVQAAQGELVGCVNNVASCDPSAVCASAAVCLPWAGPLACLFCCCCARKCYKEKQRRNAIREEAMRQQRTVVLQRDIIEATQILSAPPGDRRFIPWAKPL